MSDWYIDSWAVLDGIAFASCREPDGSGDPARGEETFEAETTIMIAPPDWRAVSISRRSTALAATRGRFQEGLVNQDDEEIAFSGIEPIRRLVKRAYLAGGLGFDGEGGAFEGPVPPPLDDPPLADAWVALVASDQPEEERRHQFITAALGSAEALRDTIRTYLEKVVRFVSTDLSHADVRDLDTVLRMFGFHLWRWLEPYTGRRFPVGLLSDPVDPRVRIRVVARLPAPRTFPGYPSVFTVADQIVAVAASRKCFRGAAQGHGLVPMFVGAMLLDGATRSDGFLGDEAWRDSVQRAAGWLADLAPQPLLDADEQESRELETLAEKLVLDIARYRYGGDDDLRSRGEDPTPQALPGEGMAREETGLLKRHVMEAE